jgi:hypothetical protein
MVWIGRINDTENEYTEWYIGGYPLERGGFVMWGDKHPFGWENFDKVEKYLYKQFERAKISQNISCIKEKFGQLRIYCGLTEKQILIYRKILLKAIIKFPGLNDWLSPDCSEEKVIFRGTEKEYKKYKIKMKKEKEEYEKIKDYYYTPEEALKVYGKSMMRKMEKSGWLTGCTGIICDGKMLLPRCDYDRAYRSVTGQHVSEAEMD